MKAISSIALYLCALALTFGLGACSKGDDAPASTFAVLRTSHDLSVDTHSATIVLSEAGFELSTDAPWLTATVQNGTEVLVKMEPNTSSESRTASVILSKDGRTHRVPFTQLGVVNAVAGLPATLSYNRKGGTSHYTLSGPDQLVVSIPEAAKSWLSYTVENGQLVLTCAPMTTDIDGGRQATITIAKGVYYHTISVAQVWGNVIYEDLLGEHTLSYAVWKDEPAQTLTVRLTPKVENQSYWLTGLAAPIEILFDESKTTLTLNPQNVAGGAAYVAGWMADGDGLLIRSGWTFSGVWDQNKLKPKFTFSSESKLTREGVEYPLYGIVFRGSNGGEYRGVGGTGISRVVQFSITKN